MDSQLVENGSPVENGGDPLVDDIVSSQEEQFTGSLRIRKRSLGLDNFAQPAVVGWSMANHMDTSLVKEAFRMAVTRRYPDPGLLHHSDQCSQYTRMAYQHCLSLLKCRVSMSRVGNCYDNAVMESFFSSLKLDYAFGQFASRAQARSAIFKYIETWYNRKRLHSSLGYLSPEEFESLSSSVISLVH